MATEADLAGVVQQYTENLEELTFNCKPAITNLTIIAGEIAKTHGPVAAANVAAAIEKRILSSPPEFKLPTLYLLDSISKNLRQPYAALFERNVADLYLRVCESASPAQQGSLQRLLGTWKPIFPSAHAVLERRAQAPPQAMPPQAPAGAAGGWSMGGPYGGGGGGGGWGAPGWQGGPPMAPPQFQQQSAYGGMMYASTPLAPPPQNPYAFGALQQPHGAIDAYPAAAPVYGAQVSLTGMYGHGQPHSGMPPPFDAQAMMMGGAPGGVGPYPPPVPGGYMGAPPPYGAPPGGQWMGMGGAGGPPMPPGPPPGGASLASLLQGLAQGMLAPGGGAPGAPSRALQFTPDALKAPPAAALRALYDDQPLQCSSTGRRFREREAYAAHLDLQYTLKRRDKEGVARSRRWFTPFDAWVSGAAAVGTDPDAAGAFFDAQAAAAAEEKAAAEKAADASVPADESQPECALTGEPFETFWHATLEEWHYRGAVRLEKSLGGVPRGKLVLVKAIPRATPLALGGLMAAGAGAAGGEEERRAAALELAQAIATEATEPELPPPHVEPPLAEPVHVQAPPPAVEAEAGGEGKRRAEEEAEGEVGAKRIKLETDS